jgi:hypothetical protein
MQSLPPALFLVLLELTVGAFFSLYLLDLRGDTSRGYIVFQGALYAVFAALTSWAMQAFASYGLLCRVGLCQRDLAAPWLAWQAPLVLTFTLLILPWNVLLWLSPAPARKGGRGRVAEHEAEDEAAETPGDSAAASASARGRRIVLARHSVGGLTALVGLAAVFVVGMAYRPLAEARLGGAFVVAAFLAGALALGGVMTAMLLGHWYLNTPTASGKPLEFTTRLLLAALLLEMLCALLTGQGTAHALPNATAVAPGTTIQTSGQTVVVTTPTPTHASQQAPATAAVREAPLGLAAFVALQYSMGFIAPLILGAVALWLTRGRSFQSATGMLYLCTAFIFIGEILGRGLLLLPVLL